MLNSSARLAMSKSVLETLPGKLYIKRHSPSIIYITPFDAFEYQVFEIIMENGAIALLEQMLHFL